MVTVVTLHQKLAASARLREQTSIEDHAMRSRDHGVLKSKRSNWQELQQRIALQREKFDMYPGRPTSHPSGFARTLTMCGKFTQARNWKDVVAFFKPLIVDPVQEQLDTSTPMRGAQIIVLNELGQREIVTMRWGFPDAKAMRPNEPPKHIHARGETVDALPTFAECFVERRGILPVYTFNEGEELPNGKTRQWVIRAKDNAVIGIGVIWRSFEFPDGTLTAFVQVTTAANKLLGTITDRMPAIIKFEDWATWLGETNASPKEVKALLVPHDDGGAWIMEPQDKPKKDGPPKKPGTPDRQPELF
jgi:putative SOS response-associated peptidase YedK